MLMMIMMMMKLTKRAKDMMLMVMMTAVIMRVKMSHAETETTICLQAMQISKNVSHSNLGFSLIKHSALFYAQSLGTDRDGNVQRAMQGLKTE